MNPIAHGLDNNNYYLMNLTLEISKALPETKSEFILSFTKDGLFNCINPGQHTQSKSTITFTVVQKPLDESTESEGNTPVRSDLSVSSFTMILTFNV
ncbi:MAG: hypothetical protein Q8R43_00900 [Alphaproteobacteria bacterium]|nr:hypothetical protein [Alphaproteobacteria bacterium]